MGNKRTKHIVINNKNKLSVGSIIRQAVEVDHYNQILITLRHDVSSDEDIVSNNLELMKELQQEGINIEFKYDIEQADEEEELNNIPLDTVIKNEEFLNKIVEEIKSKNFSPMEQYVAIFNTVNRLKPYRVEYSYEANKFAQKASTLYKNNPEAVYNFKDVDANFNFEDYGLPLEEYIKYYNRKPQSQTLSRNIHRLLDSQMMCCVGYSTVFENIAKRLNLNAVGLTMKYTDVPDAHMEIYAYIKDDKYDIDGYYVINPTGTPDIYDSPDPLYSQFLLTTDEARKDFDGTINVHSFDGFLTANTPEAFMEELINNENISTQVDFDDFINRLDPELHKTIAKDNNHIDISKDDILYMMDYFKTKTNKPIDKKKILEAIINVRKETLKYLTEADLVDITMDMSIYPPFSKIDENGQNKSLFADKYDAYILSRYNEVKDLSVEQIKKKYPFLNIEEIKKCGPIKESVEQDNSIEK